jgi:hypothetical protein
MILTFLLLASLEANNVVDSVLYNIKAKQPDSCSMRASCSLDPEAKIAIKFSKTNGVDVKSESFVGEIAKGALMLTGFGAYNFWKTIETNNISLEEGQNPGFCYLTVVSKDSSLFTNATLKVKKSAWKIEEAKITTLSDKITAKFIYNDRGMPVTIDADAQASKILIKNSYKQISPKIYIPLKTTFISTTSDTPEILIEYSQI